MIFGIYTPEKIRNTQDRLVRILRLLFFREKITFETFDACHHRHNSRFALTRQQITQSKGNDRRLLKEDKLSWDKFQYLLVDILHWEIEDFRITVKDKDTGRVITVAANDWVDDDGTYHAAPPIPEGIPPSGVIKESK